MIRFWNQLSSPRIIQVAPECLQIRGKIVHNYALMEEKRITLIDGGFLTCRPNRTLRCLEQLGHRAGDVDMILLSHGHIDHTLHLHEWKELTGARIGAPKLDAARIERSFPYRGASRLCGLMEATAGKLFRYRPPEVDFWFESGDLLSRWGGLEIIGLPGHTRGHVGFYSRTRQLLFANDLFAHWYGHSHWPPVWFNESSDEIAVSARRVIELPLNGGILLNHCDKSSPGRLRVALEEFLNY